VEAGVIRRVRSEWTGAVLICGKCSKKIGGGFGESGRAPLGKALRAFLGWRKGRKAPCGIVEVRCLGLCPKDGVTVIDPARPGQWRVVPAGTPVEDVAVDLGLIANLQRPCY
jgi:hypothetical protein